MEAESFLFQVLNDIPTNFNRVAFLYQDTLLDLARGLFALLAALEIAHTVIDRAFLAEPKEIQGFARPLLRRLLALMILWGLLNTSTSWVPEVIGGFSGAAQQAQIAASGTAAAFSPGEALRSILAIGLRVSDLHFSWIATALGQPLIHMLLALPMLLAGGIMSFIVMWMVIEGGLIMSSGVFLLGFAGYRYTIGVAEVFMRWLVSYSIRLFVIYLIIGLGDAVWRPFVDYFGNTKTASFADWAAASAGILVYAFLALLTPALASRVAGQVSVPLSRALPT